MRLFDQISADVGSLMDNWAAGSISSVAAALKDCLRFELSDEVRDAAQRVQKSKPSTIMAALPLCRLPYRRVWVEWLPGRVGNLRDAGPDAPPQPQRTGFLMEAVDDSLQRGNITWCWHHPHHHSPALRQHDPNGGETIICPLGAAFDWSPEPTIPFSPGATRREIIDGVKAFKDSPFTKHLGSASEIDALVEDSKRCYQAFSPHTKNHLQCLSDKVRREPEISPIIAQQFRSWQEDTHGELGFARAVIAILNSRNCVEFEEADLAKMNRARARRGRLPALSYSVVKFSLSRSQHNAAIASGMTRVQMREHLCRGHFKIRKTGVFWWSPHLGGKPALGRVERDHYEVAV